MLDDGLKTQLKAYLQNLRQPIELVASLGEGQGSKDMGCHSSAGVWTAYDPKSGKGKQSGQLTADFSWLLSQKASYEK